MTAKKANAMFIFSLWLVDAYERAEVMALLVFLSIRQNGVESIQAWANILELHRLSPSVHFAN